MLRSRAEVLQFHFSSTEFIDRACLAVNKMLFGCELIVSIVLLYNLCYKSSYRCSHWYYFYEVLILRLFYSVLCWMDTVPSFIEFFFVFSATVQVWMIGWFQPIVMSAIRECSSKQTKTIVWLQIGKKESNLLNMCKNMWNLK